MPKKSKSFKETPLKNPIGVPIGAEKKKPLKKSLKGSIGKNEKNPIGKNSMPDFDSIIKNSTKLERLKSLPDSEYYNNDDPKCLEHFDFILRLEKIRTDLEKEKTSKFDSKQEALRRGLDEIYRFLRVEAGYRPAWLFQSIDEILRKLGRPDNHSYDERILGSQLIQALIQYGSSQTQAINLLSALKGNAVVTEGFKRDFAETYNEYIQNISSDESLTILDIGQIIALASREFSLERVKTTKALIKSSHIALIKMCQELIDHMRKNQKLVETNDTAHTSLHDKVIDLMGMEHENPIEYFIPEHMDDTNRMEQSVLIRQMLDYMNSIDLFSKNPL